MLLHTVHVFSRRRGRTAMLGAPGEPVAEAVKACADAGGIANYDEPDPYTFVVSCANGKLCQGGAEQVTECHGGGAAPPQGSFPKQNTPVIFGKKGWSNVLQPPVSSTPTTTKPYTGTLDPARGSKPSDTATPQPAPKEEGLSTATLVTVAAVGALALGGVAYVALRKKR